ncbi:hypothetical protein [Gemmata sp.]|uniref:hypothetical protein n=1 Tax=Gemmata sp. TaxID=1914242 RepID=UPI003F70CE3A
MSVAGTIADAVVAAVTGLGWTAGAPPAAVPVVKRKKPSLPSGKNPVEVVVSVGEEGAVRPLTGSKDRVKYPATVAIFTAGGKLTGEDEPLRLRREQVRKLVNTRAAFASVPGFNRVTPEGKNPYDPAALAHDLNMSVLVFTVEVDEPRSD